MNFELYLKAADDPVDKAKWIETYYKDCVDTCIRSIRELDLDDINFNTQTLRRHFFDVQKTGKRYEALMRDLQMNLYQKRRNLGCDRINMVMTANREQQISTIDNFLKCQIRYLQG